MPRGDAVHLRRRQLPRATAGGELALTQMRWFSETYGTRGHPWSIERARNDAGTR